jgi:uncharacterized protein with HEPN domain
MRHERLYLGDIVEAADDVTRFIADYDRTRFDESELLKSAVARKLTIIGEAAAHVSKSLRAAHPEVPWVDIIAFRNFLIQDYFGIDWHVVWKAATLDVPVLRPQIAAILADYPEN